MEWILREVILAMASINKIIDSVDVLNKVVLDKNGEYKMIKEPYTIDDLLLAISDTRLGELTRKGITDSLKKYQLMKLY